MTEIRKIAGLDPHDAAAVDRAFEGIAPEPIACCNWPDEWPYAPEVSFRMFHTGDYLMLRFDVAEGYTAARVAEDNGRVWTDSCVEFFLQTEEGGGYYNFETTAIGRMLLGYRHTHADAVHAAPEVMRQVLRTPTIGTEPFAERAGDNRWRMTLAIPPVALFRDALASWDSVEARMNLYKCGDDLSHPHFLSWLPIEAPKPNFHLPEFFGRVRFAAE